MFYTQNLDFSHFHSGGANSVYDSVTFFPGEYLNIIIGANGTGKSTIVSAIVLGMGGNANVLGRMSQVSKLMPAFYFRFKTIAFFLQIKDYVKNGKEEAFVEVTIYNSDEDTKDRRTFSRHFDCNGSDKFSVSILFMCSWTMTLTPVHMCFR